MIRYLKKLSQRVEAWCREAYINYWTKRFGQAVHKALDNEPKPGEFRTVSVKHECYPQVRNFYRVYKLCDDYKEWGVISDVATPVKYLKADVSSHYIIQDFKQWLKDRPHITILGVKSFDDR